MCYGDNGTVKFLETLADNVLSHNYSMMQILKKLNYGKMLGLPRPTPLKLNFFTSYCPFLAGYYSMSKKIM
jgi:hypothetical protein